jgi:hypothetical protein
MKQSAVHEPAAHTVPAPQLVPLPRLDHAVVELDGAQT